MKKIFLGVAVLSLALAFSGLPAQANLLTNGSFENTTGFVPDVNDVMILNPGATTMTGWTVISGGGSLTWDGPTNLFGLTASQGSYFLDLTGYHDDTPYGGVQQTIGTIPGQAYVLSFDLGSSTTYGVPDAITAAAGSTSQTFTSTNTTLTNAWETEVLNFTATSGTTLISLTGALANHYIGLDNISVEGPSPVPLPPSVWLFGSGLLGLIGFKKKLSA